MPKSNTSKPVGIIKWFARFFGVNGVDLKRMAYAAMSFPQFFRDMSAYCRKTVRGGRFPFRVSQIYPCLADYRETSGSASGHYFHQDLYVARKIFERQPSRHVDIGSRIDGFIAHLLCFMPVDCVDIRPLTSSVAGLNFVQSDATQLANFATESLDSISSLHAAEHFGLGRYGDPVDPDACFHFMSSLKRVLAPGGRLYFSVPVGLERLEFNAQRVFAPETVMAAFQGLSLVSFSAVLDDKNMYEGIGMELAAAAEFGCGIFEFTKSITY